MDGRHEMNDSEVGARLRANILFVQSRRHTRLAFFTRNTNFGDRIVAARPPWMTAQEATDAQGGAAPEAVPFERLEREIGTGGEVPAAGPEHGRDQPLVTPDQPADRVVQTAHGR